MSHRLTPLYVFDDAAEYHRRHSSGVLKEFDNESKEVKGFNARQPQFKAWVIAKLYSGRERTYWVFLVRPGEQAVERLFPREGETCEIMLWNRAGKTKRWEKYWEAERIENPAASFSIPEGEAHRMPAFKVKVPNNVPDDIIRPLEDDPDEVGYDAPSRLSKKHALGDKKAYRVTFNLRISSATKDAEIGAIDILFKNPDNVLTPKQEGAFKYLLNFKQTSFKVNLFNYFPHLKDPMKNPGDMPPKVVNMLKGFNEHQRIAYKEVLSSLPCGVGIIPGGPGAGKTHWNLVLTVAIQSKNIIYHGPDSFSKRSAKVLYVLDINKPLDDTCNKIVKLYKRLGLKKYAVRLYGWHYGTDGGKVNFANKFMLMARVNRYRRQASNEGCLAPTLDELVWDFYEANKTTRYRQLHDLLSKTLNGSKDPDPSALRDFANQLYRDVLDHVDFIATTPVPAATRFSGLFKPDLVIFDESPHAREASTMVSIAQYEPIAWIFSGDHRQTRPYVASDDVRDNPWAPQMLVSMMERADRAHAIHHSLLINHRAYGGLQVLASSMFYDKKMISGHSEEELFPPSVRHLQRYLERFLPPDQKCREPRLIAFDGSRAELRVGTSWYNPSHIEWVMKRVQELLPDAMFKQVGKNERGTILIISPYKESYMKYKRAIKDLPAAWQARLNVEKRAEARTIDTVQGGEADFVFLDMVRSAATDFTDDPNRLNVALTRARQAEIILMHPAMKRGSHHLSRVFAHCDVMGQVIEIADQNPRSMAQVPDEERVSHGLNALSVHNEDENHQPVGAPDLTVGEEDEPPSIFSPQFAGLADFIKSILVEKKAKNIREGHDGQDQTQPRANSPDRILDAASRVSYQVQAQTGPRAISGSTVSGALRTQLQASSTDSQPRLDVQVQTGAQNATKSSQVDQRLSSMSQPVGNGALEASVTQLPNSSAADTSDAQSKSPGLLQSRWSSERHQTPVSTMPPSQTRPSITASDQGVGSAKPTDPTNPFPWHQIQPVTDVSKAPQCAPLVAATSTVHPNQAACAAQHPVDPPTQLTLAVGGDQSVRTNANKEVPSLPSGSSWW